MPKPPLQCIVESGEAIYVPTNWRHATCNLSPLTLSFGGQGDLGAFSGRQLIDAILDNDEAAALKLLKSRPKRLRQLLRARSKQGLSAVHVSRLDPASCLPAVDAPTCVCSRRWLSCTTASGRCVRSPQQGPTSPSRCSAWRRTTARCWPPPSGTSLTRSSLCCASRQCITTTVLLWCGQLSVGCGGRGCALPGDDVRHPRRPTLPRPGG